MYLHFLIRHISINSYISLSNRKSKSCLFPICKSFIFHYTSLHSFTKQIDISLATLAKCSPHIPSLNIIYKSSLPSLRRSSILYTILFFLTQGAKNHFLRLSPSLSPLQINSAKLLADAAGIVRGTLGHQLTRAHNGLRSESQDQGTSSLFSRLFVYRSDVDLALKIPCVFPVQGFVSVRLRVSVCTLIRVCVCLCAFSFTGGSVLVAIVRRLWFCKLFTFFFQLLMEMNEAFILS